MPFLSTARRAALVVHITFLLAAGVLLADDKQPVPAIAAASEPEVDPARAARLAERDALSAEAQELLANGDAADAEDRARAELAIEQAVLGNDDPELIGTLNLIAQCQEAQEAWDSAIQTRDEIITRSLAAYGDNDYRVVDARLAVEQVDVLRRLTAAERAELSEAALLISQIDQHYSSGQFTEATGLAQRVLQSYGQILGEQHPDYAGWLHNVAHLYKLQGDYARAEPLYRQALEIWRALLGERHPDYARSLNNLALLYEAQGEYAQAEPLYRQALEIRKEVLGERHPDYALSLYTLANLCVAQGDYARAEPLYRQALEIRKEVLGERHLEYAASLDGLAQLYHAQGDCARAEPLCRQATEILKEVIGERHPDYAVSLNNLGILYVTQGDYARAEPLCKQASEIWKAVFGERHPYFATSLHTLAELYDAKGDYARAEPLYRQALEIRKEVLGERHAHYAETLNNLARLYKVQRDYVRAEPLYRQALEIWKEVFGERHPSHAVSLNNLAALYKAQGDYVRAETLYLQALEIRKEVLGERHPDYALSLSNLALLYQAQRDFARAEPLLWQALEIWKEGLGERHGDYAACLNNLAGLYHAQGDYARAEPLFRQVLDIWKEVLGERHPHYATGLNNLALLLSDLGIASEGLSLSQTAVGISADLLEETASVQSERQQLASARNVDSHADGLLSLACLTGAAADGYYPSLLASKGQVFVRQRAIRQLREQTAEAPESPVAQTFAVLADRARELDRLAKSVPASDELDSYRLKLEELTLEVESLQQTLATLSSEYRRSQQITALTPTDLAVRLPGDAALIDVRAYDQYLPHDAEHTTGHWERQYAAFITRHDRSVEVIWLGPAEPINAAVLAWHKHFGVGLGDDAAMELRRLVWEPLEVHLDAISTVLISPDGELNAVPFAALPGSEPETFVIEERAFVTIPAPLLLPEILARQVVEPTNASLLLVGDVDYGSDPGLMELVATERGATAARDADGRWNWDRLPQTRVEVVSIDDTFFRAFGRAPSVSLREAEATEQAFRNSAAAAMYVHIATHGYFAPEELKSILSSSRADEETISLFGQQDVSGWHPGLLSGIVLAGANQPPDPERDDGVLTALEVAELDLSGVELATLSACETGLGQTAGGEGLLGLQRSFQLAGARTTVASLWKVDDVSTRSLMTEFYENLWRKKMSRVEALRQSQLSMLRGELDRGVNREGPDEVIGRLPPYYWAAFVLSGDWR